MLQSGSSGYFHALKPSSSTDLRSGTEPPSPALKDFCPSGAKKNNAKAAAAVTFCVLLNTPTPEAPHPSEGF